MKHISKVNIISPLKPTNLKNAVATLKTTKGFEFRIAQVFCIQIILMFLFIEELGISFAWSKSIGVSHQLSYTSPTGYSNFDKINTHHNSDTLHYQQQSLPLTIMTLLVSGREIKLLVDREDKNDIRNPKVKLR